MIAQRAVLFLFLFGTHHFCLPGKARDRFIRWRKSGRNNNGNSNQQQCLLFVRLNTLTHSKCAIRSRHCEFVMAKRNFMRSEISYTLYSGACARTSTMFLQFHKLNFLHNMRLCKMTHIRHSGTERATSKQKRE